MGRLGYILTQQQEWFACPSCQHHFRRGYVPCLVGAELVVETSDGRSLHCAERENGNSMPSKTGSVRIACLNGG
jgi:hypothetical protein